MKWRSMGHWFEKGTRLLKSGEDLLLIAIQFFFFGGGGGLRYPT